MAKENEKVQDEFATTFSSMDGNFVTRTNELHAAVNGNRTKYLYLSSFVLQECMS